MAHADQRQLFAIDGLFCGGCARGLESRLQRLDGVAEAGVHFVTASALVRWDGARCDRDRIAACVDEAGYRLIERHDLGETAARLAAATRMLAYRLAIAVFFGMFAMGAAWILYAEPDLDRGSAWWIAFASGVMTLPVLTFGGAGMFRMGVRSITLRTASIDLLLGLSTLGTVALSIANLVRGEPHVYFDAAAMLVTLRLAGQLIETRVRANATAALQAIEALAPETARRVDEDQPVPIAALATGDRVIVDAGAVVTIDGVIERGESMVDRALLTGESGGCRVGPDDRVQAGTINLERRLIVIVDRFAGDRDVDRMGGRVAIEIAGKGTRTGLTDRVIAWLVVAMPVLSLAALAIGVWRTGSLWAGIANALAVAVVICPCALTIAQPLAHLRAVARGAREGLRIADPGQLDALASVGAAVFDKTGTLTTGDLRVVAVTAATGWAEADVLTLAAAAETGIDHPIARAIVAAAGGEIGPGGVRDGRAATFVDRDVIVRTSADAGPDGRMLLDVMVAGSRAGTIALDDAIDPAAVAMMRWFHDHRIALRLATGDAEGPAHAVAAAVGLGRQEIAAGCTPAAKADLVRSLDGPVLVVGDGINDAPALAAADCSVTVARAHAAATATAGIAIVEGGLSRIAVAMRIARRARGVVAQNVALAIGYNLIAVPIALAGGMTPLIAAIAMTASSAAVSLNALRAG